MVVVVVVVVESVCVCVCVWTVFCNYVNSNYINSCVSVRVRACAHMCVVTENIHLISSTAQTPLAQPPSSSSQLQRMHTCTTAIRLQRSFLYIYIGFFKWSCHSTRRLQRDRRYPTTALNCLLLFENGNFNVTIWTRDLLFISFFKIYFGRYVLPLK